MSFLNRSLPSSPWFYIQKPKPQATLRLFCFPYAGGGASIFRDWFKFLPEEIEVVAVRPPGRENRFNEPPINSLATLVDLLYQNILPLLDKPFVFLGHSNGALTCFELARLLEKKNGPVPTKVILSAKCPPHIESPSKSISHLPDNEFVGELEDISGTPQEVLQNKELMELLIPVLKADFSLSENHSHENNTLLKAETILFYGLQDKVTKHHIMAWQDLLLMPHQLYAFSDGHFFIDSQREQFLSLLDNILKEHLSLHYNKKYC